MRLVIAFGCILLLISSCASSGTDVVQRQLHRDFFALPVDAQKAKFREYDIETQYELVILGNQLVEPPEIFLTREFASQGSVVVPVLSEKLAETHNEATIRDIVATFVQLQRSGLFKIASNADLMSLIDKRVGAMQGQWKSITRQMLQELQGTAGGSAR